MSVMELGHRSILSAHLGRKATEDKITSNFFGQELLGQCKDTLVPVTLVKHVHLLEKIQNCH